MICNNCKKEVETGTIICPYCGCLTEENSNDSVDTINEMTYSNNENEYKDTDNNSYKFGIFVSILVLIAGIVFFFYSSFGDIGSTERNFIYGYGANAYTGIQNAAAQTANNVYYLIICVSKGIGILTSSIGLISLSYFIQKSKNK